MVEAFDWAYTHFGAARLPDVRLQRSLVEVASRIRANPCGTLPRSMQDSATLKSAYHLLSHNGTSHEQVLGSHVAQTRAACAEAGSYLLIEDTTALSFSQRGPIAGMGIMSSEHSQGLFVHTTLAANITHWSSSHVPEVCLKGLFGQECWARQQPEGTRKERKKTKRKSVNRKMPVESDRWARAICDSDPPPDNAHWTFVADRESDIFEVMMRCRQRGVSWVIRAAQHRKTYPLEQDIFEAVNERPVLGTYDIALRARPGVSARTAKVSVRSLNVSIRPKPAFRSHYAPLETGLVEVSEDDPPDGVTPLHWLLLSDWPCTTLTEARRVIGAYTRRWLIEEYHKSLKTGTSIEETQLSTAERVETLLAIHAVVATDLVQLKLLTKQCPDDPVGEDMIPEDSLHLLEQEYGRPPNGWTNKTLIRTIAKMGGYLGRKNDGPPGWLTIWRGLYQLMLMTRGYRLANTQ